MKSMTTIRPDCPQRRPVRRTLSLPLLFAALPALMLSAAPGAGARVAANTVALEAEGAAQARVQSAGDSALERRVKAAFLYKFLGYAEFPAPAFDNAGAPLVIGVVGADDIAGELTRIVAGRSVNGRPIVVRALREADLAQPTHMLFVAGADDARSTRLLRASTAPLTVTECDGGLAAGAVINFTIVDDRVRFDVSLDAAEKKNIKLSSRLLVVANRVQKGAT
jgi:hypothetical protein